MRVYVVAGNLGNAGLPQLGRAVRVYLSSSVGFTDPPSLGQAVRIYLGVVRKPDADADGSGRDAIAMGETMRLYLGAQTQSAGHGPSGEQGCDNLAMGRAAMPGLRVLLSYHYFKDHDLDLMCRECFAGIPDLDLFADSGAFSAFTVGETIDVDQYCAWLNRWKHLFTAASAPDVIGDAAATASATTKMLAQVQGIPVLPVFHVGEDWSYLERWCKTPGVDYIALGGMVPYARRTGLLERWLDKAWTFIPPHVRVHGFGMTTWSLLRRFPWYSVDSSSWTAGVRYANLSLFDERLGRFVAVDMRQRTGLLKHAALLKAYGLRPTEAKNKGYDRDQIVGACVRSWQLAEAWLNRVRKVA